MTYKKINNSTIDFVIVHQDNTLTPVIVSERNSLYLPKIYSGFHKEYGHRVRRYIKAIPLSVSVSSFEGKEFFCVPYFMISKVF